MIKEIIDSWQKHPVKGKLWFDTVNTHEFQEVISMARLAAIEESAHHIEGMQGQDFLVAMANRMSFIEGYNAALIFLQRIAKAPVNQTTQTQIEDYENDWVAKYNSTLQQ